MPVAVQATLLPSGEVLVIGGITRLPNNTEEVLSSVEIFDPSSDNWSEAESLAAPRSFHNSLLLPNGKVLVLGGRTLTGKYTGPPELYDPLTNTWSDAASTTSRAGATATLLLNGKVLVVGDSTLPSLYDPASNSWTSGGIPSSYRSNHTATLLANGKVLVTGGQDATSGTTLSTTEVYDPVSNTWSQAANLTNSRALHTATLLPNGKVLVQGGAVGSFLNTIVYSAELYDPTTNAWSSAGNNPFSQKGATATLLPNGNVVIMGGANESCIDSYSPTSDVVMMYAPSTNSWAQDTKLQIGRYRHAATMLPNGKIVLSGGCDCNNGALTYDVGEFYDPANTNGWTVNGSLMSPRRDHAATILPNGKTLVSGGNDGNTYLGSTELYDPSTQTWTATGSLNAARTTHAATLLSNGNVLVTGGFDGTSSLASTELYDQASGIWSTTGNMSQGRRSHTATLLPNGDVLVVGGFSGTTPLKSAEVYSAASGTWKSLASLNTPRANHTMTLLSDGRILVTGGYDGINYLDSVELYDPVANSWSTIEGLGRARAFHAATLLEDGSVMIAGGNDGTGPVALAELFDADNDTWAELDLTGPTGRAGHTATLLADGNVLLAGGAGSGAADIYSPVTDLWLSGGTSTTPRTGHTATLQPDGSVLLAGGYNSVNGVLSSSEIYNPIGAAANQRPLISGMELSAGQPSLTITGSGFRGSSEGSSSASNNSSTGFPMVQLKRVDNNQSAFLSSDPVQTWSSNAFTSESLADLFLPAGYYRATVFANAVPSLAQFVRIDSTVAAAPSLGISPVPLDFGSVLNTTTRNVAIANNGSANLVVSSVSMDGTDAAQFSFLAGACLTEIMPETNCQVEVTFSPSSVNQASAYLRVLSNDPNNESYVIPLKGSGAAFLTLNIIGAGSGSVSVLPNPPGTDCSATCSQALPGGTAVTLTPSPNVGSAFSSWSNCDAVNGTICSVTMTSSKSVTASFSNLAISSELLAEGSLFSPYGQTLTATGGTAPYGWTIFSGSLPTGLSLNSGTGVISGMPTAVGTSNFTIKLTDTMGTTVTKPFVITVSAPLTISTSSLPTGTTGTPYSQTVAVTGGKTPYAWSIATGSLPAGLVLDAGTGIVAGTPTIAGTSNFTVQVTDANNTAASKAYSVVVSAGTLTVTTSTLPAGCINAVYGQAMTASGGSMPFTWSITKGSLPAGMTLNAATGTISGTPTASGTWSFTAQVKDASAKTATKSLSLTVNAAVTVSTTSLAAGNVGSTYNQTLAAGGGKAPFSWTITSGSLPAGLSLDGVSGAITGTPTTTGSSSFTVQVKDSTNATATKALAITINAAVLAVSTVTLPDASVDTPYSQTLTAMGGKAPYTWTKSSGTLPAGLTLSSAGTLAGTPTTAGSYSFTVQVKDANRTTATRTFTVAVYGIPVINSVSPQTGTVGSPYSYTFTVSGGKAPYGWSVVDNSLPPGLSLNAATGAVSGTPTASGLTYPVLQVKDANNATSSTLFSLTINSVLGISTESLPHGFVGSGYRQILSAGGGSEPYVWSITGGTLPAGLSLDIGTGAISGTPTINETRTVMVQARDAGGVTASRAFTLAVYSAPAVSTPNLSDGYVGSPYNQVLTATGGKSPYYWSIVSGNLPSGLTLNADTGAVSGTPSSSGESSFIVRVRDSNNIDATRTLSIATYAAPSVSTTSLADGYVGTTCIRSLAVLGGKQPYSWQIASGSLPAGLSLNANTGVISGVPTSIGSSNFTVQVKDANFSEATKTLTIAVNPAMVIDTASLPDSYVGVAYSQALSASGGKPSYTWSVVSGSLPAGFTLDSVSGLISGTPSVVENSSFIVQVMDANGTAVTKPLSISVTAPPYTLRNLGDSGNIAVMELTGNYDAKKPDGTSNSDPRQAVVKEFIRTHGDGFDFVVFLSTFDYAMLEPTSPAFYTAAKNDVQGIGEPFFDGSSLFGSAGRLQGTIDMGNVAALAGNPYGTKLDETVAVLNHEIGHRWGARARFKNPDGTLNGSLLGKESVHWSYLLDTQGSLMYGSGWRDNRDGTFTATSTRAGYSPLDLYLMGMITKEQVSPMLLIDNPAIDKTQMPQPGATVSGTAKTVTIDDIIAAEGVRIPDAANSPKQFKVGFVLLTRPSDSSTAAAAAIETLRSAWAGRFAELTRGAGRVADVPASLTMNIDTPTDNATVTGPDVTVSGTVINSSGAETGITVNGIPATISGSRFMVNHVPLQTGSNTLTITATDANGLTSTTTRSVTAQAGHYLRVTSNVDSGTGPLDISIRLDASFPIASPTVSIAGPVSVSPTPGASQTEFTAKLDVEGSYTITASATGPDGQTYSDSVTVTVVSKAQLETLLQGKWSGIRSKLSQIDVDGAVSYLMTSSQASYRDIFTSFGPRLPVLSADTATLRLEYAHDVLAKCLLIRQETVIGEQRLVAYPVYYIKENGQWKLQKY